MKSPEEIKKGLEYLATRDPAKKAELWETGIAYDWQEDAAGDALAYIQQLEADNAQQARCIENLTDKLNATNDALPRWISVKERMPEERGRQCLCLCQYEKYVQAPGCTMLLHWEGHCDNGYVDRPHFSNEGMCGMYVTHWMPLPEPPEVAHETVHDCNS